MKHDNWVDFETYKAIELYIMFGNRYHECLMKLSFQSFLNITNLFPFVNPIMETWRTSAALCAGSANNHENQHLFTYVSRNYPMRIVCTYSGPTPT